MYATKVFNVMDAKYGAKGDGVTGGWGDRRLQVHMSLSPALKERWR